MSLTVEQAQRMITSAQLKADEIGVKVSTAIVDPDGRLFAFSRMEGAHWISIEVSQAKAYTAALLRRPGTDLANLANSPFFASLVALHQGRVFPAASVTPAFDASGALVAGVGCSGATDDQDGECARAAAAAYAG